MSSFYNYDTRGASTASQMITMERVLSEKDEELTRLRADIENLHAENKRLRVDVKDENERLHAENERLRGLLDRAADMLHDCGDIRYELVDAALKEAK